MKVESAAGPSVLPLPNTTNSQVQNDARARAIAKLTPAPTTGQAQEHPVQDPTRLAPEDLTAVTQGQNNVVEPSTSEQAPAEANPPAAKDKELLSTQYAQLARREKAIFAKAQARDQALARREAEIAQREKAVEAKDAEYQTSYIPKQKLTENTVETLLENGISYDQITQLMLNQSNQDPATKVALAKIEAQIKAQNEAREADRNAAKQAEAQQYQAALRQIRADATDLVKSDPQFEAIRKTNSIKDVVELIEETFKADGRVMSVDEACREVEDHLVEKLSEYSRIEKIQQRLNAGKRTAPEQSGQNTQQRQPTPTLKNADGTSKKLSAKERAILAFKGELRK